MNPFAIVWNRSGALRRLRRAIGAAGLASAVAGLPGCYVVPLQPAPAGLPGAAPMAVGAAAVPLSFGARLYPANDLAAPYGVVAGSVTNDLHGRGLFSLTLAGESYAGEATRGAGSAREGQANAVGSRGGYLACRYQMNSPTLGSGQCRLHNGAQFTLHVGG